jgi:translocation and assembly module TamB
VVWALLAVGVLAALLGVGVTLLLRSQRLHEYALARAQQSASESLGVPVRLQNFVIGFHGLNPELNLYGLVVSGATVIGAGAQPMPPLLQVERARIAVQIVSLLRHSWYVDEIAVHHAVAQVRVAADGSNNLPRPKPSNSSESGVQQLFDLAIHHLSLDQSALYYNDRRGALDADMQDVMLRAAFDPSRKVYAGELGYTGGRLKSGAYAPIPHALHAEFEMTPTHLALRRAELRSGSSSIQLSGTLDDFSNPRVNAAYNASVSATELRSVLRNALHNAQLPEGVVLLNGRATYAARPNQPALNAIAIDGTLSSERLLVSLQNGSLQNGRTEVRALRAAYSLKNGDAEIPSLRAALLGGTVEARAVVRNIAGTPGGTQTGTVHLSATGISLADLRQLAASAAPPDVTVSGSVQATADAQWRGAVQNATAMVDVSIDGQAGSAASGGSVPVAGEVHAEYRNGQLSLRQSSLHTARTSVALDGTLSAPQTALQNAGGKPHTQMNVAVNAQDLHELETVAAIFAKPAQPLGLFGAATFTAAITGPLAAPQLTGELRGTNLRVRGTEWRSVHARVQAGPDEVGISEGSLLPVSTRNSVQRAISFSGHARLKHWKWTPESQFQLAVNAPQLDAAALARLGGVSQPVSGALSVSMQAHGSQNNPLGEGRIALTRASLGGEAVSSAVIQFNGDGNTIHANVNVAMPAGRLSGVLTYNPVHRSYELQAQSQNFRIDRLQTVKARNMNVSGAVNLTASGRGTLDDPQLTASIEIPQLTTGWQAAQNFSVHAEVAQHAANVTLNTRVANTALYGHATVQLSGNYMAEAALDSAPIALQPLVAAYAPAQAANVTGETELHATLRGSLKQPRQMEAHAVIPKLSVNYQKSVSLAASTPIHADYVDGVLTVQRSGLKGTGTDLQFQGSIPVLDRSKPMALLLVGSVDLHLAQLFDPGLSSSGEMRFNINSLGASTGADVHGDVQIVNANIAEADAPVGLSNGNGSLRLTSNRLDITSFEGTVGGGKVTARGGLVYRPALRFDFVLAGSGIRMLYPDGVRQALSTNLTLTGGADNAALRGQVNVDQLSFAPDFDLNSLSQFGGGVAEPPSRGPLSLLHLDVNLRSSQNINLVSRTMSASGSTNLRITGTADQPVVLGRINLTGGDLIYSGNRYLLQGGVIDFINPTRTEPNVNVAVTTTIQQYDIALRFEGPADRLRTSYSSDPALPPADIINLLAFGKTQEAANAASAGSSNTLTAEQSIASAVSGQVTSRMQKIAGISQLSIDPTLGTSQQNAGATITVQQRVTSKIYVTFSTDVTSTQQEVIQFQYQATPRVALSGTRDQNGGFGVEARITREW